MKQVTHHLYARPIHRRNACPQLIRITLANRTNPNRPSGAQSLAFRRLEAFKVIHFHVNTHAIHPDWFVRKYED